jgi:hypothetical protein
MLCEKRGWHSCPSHDTNFFYFLFSFLSFSSRHVRAWPGGVGDAKCGGNYAPGIQPQLEALRQGCQQVLWLFGEDHKVTEVRRGRAVAHFLPRDARLHTVLILVLRSRLAP